MVKYVLNAGWDKIAKLVEALFETDGLAISNRLARQIKDLWGELEEYDEKPLKFSIVPRKPPTKAQRAGHITLTAMKR